MIALKITEVFVINENNNSNRSKRKPWVFIGVFISILILLGFIFTVMPKGLKMTHEQIGTGKPALVFVYDPNLVVSSNQTDQMNKAREKLNGEAYFLIAQISSPEGDQLIAKHKAKSAELLLFDSTGKLIKRRLALVSSNDLIQWITGGTP